MLAWYLSGARCRLAYGQLTLLPLTVSCSSKIQIGFTFLVPAHPGSPGKRAVKRVCVCVCVCVCEASILQSHTMGKQGSCLEKEIMQGTTSGARRRGMPRTARMDNIKTWTGLSVEESIRMTEDTDKWRKYVHGVANPQIEDG